MSGKPGKARPLRLRTRMCVTILGCGTSVGVPMIGHVEPHHRQAKNRRLRASCLIEPFGRGGPALLIDTSPDLREQVLRYFVRPRPRLDAVLLTHEHADHLHGIDDIRPFNFLQKRPMPFFGEARVLEAVRHRFSYIFHPIQIGGGIPQVELYPVSNTPFVVPIQEHESHSSVMVQPLPLIHGKVSCLGFRVGDFAYITDCSEIPEATLALLTGLDCLVLDCLRPASHSTHLNVEQALAYARQIQAKRTIFTHMGSEIEYEKFKRSLPQTMRPAYDGMKMYLRAPQSAAAPS